MVSRRSNLGVGCSRLACLVFAALVAGCSAPVPPTDPGRLEVWNWVREPLAVIVGGRLYQIPACQASVFEDVELRGVRIATPSGILVADFDADSSATPIGRSRYIVIGEPGSRRDNLQVADLRTRPSKDPPAGRDCHLSLSGLLNGQGRVDQPPFR